ncbi:hypothetical protein RvY_02960 [Ramazzottius varieornatus]|uniref:Uncharacterized protein n=1 Tax=Ramazzottius varieornatus TaxID=947166 RepID=A0A1D1ULE9_RAMVA|nr:hypothetical protein RvY_02960 [Ramazzottius varieornatus]
MLPLATLALYFASAITYIDASVYTVKCYQCAYNFPQPYPADGVPMNYDYVWRKPPAAVCLSGSVDDLSPYLQDCSGHRELQEADVWNTSPAVLTCYTTFFYSDETKTKRKLSPSQA